MVLTVRIYVGGERIDYAHNTRTGKHELYFMGGHRCPPKRGVRGTAPEVIGVLQEFSGNSEVKDLIEWLSR